MTTTSTELPDPSSTDYTERLLECMKQRLDLLSRLHAVTEQALNQTATDDINSTLTTIARKQEIIDALSEVQQQLQPYQRDEPEQRKWITPERREACQDVASRGNRLLTQILEWEQSTIEDMQGRRDVVEAQLKEGSNAILAHNAYAASDNLQHSSLDIADL